MKMKKFAVYLDFKMKNKFIQFSKILFILIYNFHLVSELFSRKLQVSTLIFFIFTVC